MARSSQMRAERLRRSRPPLSRERFRRSVSTAPGHPVLGLAALRRAFAWSLLSCFRPMSRSIGEALPNDASQHAIGALYVINTKRDPLVVAEIELREIPFQMLFADVVVHADDAALQDREITLHGVGVRVAANVLLPRSD